ncbi:uncharacterized protein LOC129224348 [Uloborus diversus]|uniref:uncharacterized protein LOC129224348 n=1 Tax=Uloborus diversus TaxID=327109 RepID=UPI00240A9668|nr:uncharacterized protein LOC129224348 [Uloborus diversus]
MEMFIENVRSYPCLWDMDNPAYKDFDAMEKAWVKVAAAANFPDAKSARMKWKKLRDNFREALKRQKDSSKSSSSRVWRYQKQMEFLIPYMQSKDFTHNDNEALLGMSPSSSNNNNNNHDSLSVSVFDEATGNALLKRSAAEAVLDDESGSSGSKKKMPYLTEEFPHGSDDVGDFGDLNRNLVQPGNPLLDFFCSMYNTTELLPRQLQLQVKKKIFEIVTEAEETAIVLQQQGQEYDVHQFL